MTATCLSGFVISAGVSSRPTQQTRADQTQQQQQQQ